MAPSWSEITKSIPKTQSVDTSALGYKLGDKVLHSKFGVGTVISLVPDGDDTQVTVAYPAPTGIKKLMASFAKLEKINA
jgi:DNA helicase-2/ATP-dependent DNA helicase PcrA